MKSSLMSLHRSKSNVVYQIKIILNLFQFSIKNGLYHLQTNQFLAPKFKIYGSYFMLKIKQRLKMYNYSQRLQNFSQSYSIINFFYFCGLKSANSQPLFVWYITLYYMYRQPLRTCESEVSSQSQDEIEHLFPKITSKQFKHYLNNIQTSYLKDIHSDQLINYCYRCHNYPITQAYLAFKDKQHPELQEPRISVFFGNDCFIDFNLVGLFLEKKGEYPSPCIQPVPASLGRILDEIFQRYGYIPHYERFLLFFPTYLEKHVDLRDYLFQGNKIDSKIAYFLAFCGAAQMSSVYMMIRYYKQFKRIGGDLSWINQAKFPSKYKRLLEINRVLAKSVWEMNEQLIAQLIENSGFHWNRSQLAICLSILSFSHQNSTIALAIGLQPQENCDKLELLGIQQVIKLITDYRTKQYQTLKVPQELAMLVDTIHIDSNSQISTESECSNSFKKSLRKSQGEEEVEAYMKEIGQELSRQQLMQKIHKNLKPLLSEHKIVEKRRENKYPMIDYSEFNFTFMAYPILNNLTDKVADKFLNIINYSQTMSRQNFGSESNCNTKQFRKAMRYYAQNLCGYRHLQYDYKQNISVYLTLPLKFYIRLLALSPVHINKHVIKQIHHESGKMQCFDLGHVSVIIANTQMSLQITLALRAMQDE